MHLAKWACGGTVTLVNRRERRESCLQPFRTSNQGVRAGVRQRGRRDHLSRGPWLPDRQTGLNNRGETSRRASDCVGRPWRWPSRPPPVRSSTHGSRTIRAGEYHKINAGSPPFGTARSSTIPAGLNGQTRGHRSGGESRIRIGPGPNWHSSRPAHSGLLKYDIIQPLVQQWNCRPSADGQN